MEETLCSHSAGSGTEQKYMCLYIYIKEKQGEIPYEKKKKVEAEKKKPPAFTKLAK